MIEGSASALNLRMVDSLRRLRAITTPEVEQAFRRIRRDQFLPDVPLSEVYSDRCIVTKRMVGRDLSSASQPALVACVLEQLDLKPDHRVLEVGAGTGYNAALMASIVGPTGIVHTIDIEEDVAAQAARNLKIAGVRNVRVIAADGALGCGPGASYDRIVLTVGSADISPAWRDQLVEGGRIVIPLSIRGPQKSIAFLKRGEWLNSVDVQDCHYIDLRGEFAAGVERMPGRSGSLAVQSEDAEMNNIDSSLLEQKGYDTRTSTIVTMSEVSGSLSIWLALQFKGFGRVGAISESVRSRMFRDVRSAPELTVAVYQNRTICLLTGPPRSVAFSYSPFELYLRTFGSDPDLSGEVLKAVRSWVAARRPGNDSLSVRACCVGREAGASAQFVLHRRFNTYFFDWPSR